jgi:hypothetical protein
LAGDETGNGDGGKSDGDEDKVVGQATASNGEGGRQLIATRVMVMVTATTWLMATVTRLAGDKEGKGEGGKCDGDGDEGGRRRRGNGNGGKSDGEGNNNGGR